jgi:hypothetical protein
LGEPGFGTAIIGLKPKPPASVAVSGTAPLLNSEPLRISGLNAGEPGLQVPDISDVPKPAAAFVVISVASTGKFAVAPAASVAGHSWMAPGALFTIELPKLNWIAPSVPPGRMAGSGELAGAANVGGCVELGGVVELGGAVVFGIVATWAKLGPPLSEKIAAAVRNKTRTYTSSAISD